MGMPFPEGLTAKCSDDEHRAMCKFAQSLFEQTGQVGLVCFPEGNEPFYTDTKQRLLIKINAMQASLVP